TASIDKRGGTTRNNREPRSTKQEIQAVMNLNKKAQRLCKCKLEARDLQEEIIRIDGTTHLIERESSTDIVMSDKEEVKPTIANETNEVEELQVKFQSMSTQEENKESHSTKMDSSTHVKVQKDITALRWAPQNRARDMSTKQTQIAQLDESLPNTLKGKSLAIKEHEPSRESSPETEPSTSTWQVNIRERNSGSYNRQENTNSTHGTNNSQLLPERKLLEEILKKLSNLERKQEHSTSPFQTSGQILASCDNSAANNKRENTFTAPKIDINNKSAIVNAIQNKENINLKIECHNINGVKANPQKLDLLMNWRGQKKEKKSKTYKAIVQISRWIRKGKKNQNQKIDTNLKEEMSCNIQKINKKLNIEIAGIGDHWSSELIQDLKGWWTILSQKDKADKNRAKLKEIQERINDRCKIIDGKQGQMLASLLDKPFNKIKIDRLVKENGLQRSLVLETNEILTHTKEHFISQFKRESLNLGEMPDKWKSIYKPKDHIQENISKAIISSTATILSGLAKGKLDELQRPILKLAKTKAELATTTANSIFYHPNICNFKNLAGEITIKRISSLHTRLNSAGPEAEIAEIRFLQGLSLGRIVNTTWDTKFNKLLQGLWKYNLICQTIEDALERQVSFKPKSIKWEVKGEGPTILELMNPKLNFKAAKTLEKFNIFYANQLILQDNKTLATWRQLKLVKCATSKERKPIWFEHLESLLLQDPVTREIKNDLYINADLKGLAIPKLQNLSVDKRIKDWVITKEMDSEHILGHIVKKSSNSVLIEHWKELDHVVPGQSKLEKYDKCALSIDPAQDPCTLRLSKNKILGALPKSALESSSKTTKIKTNLWQGVQSQQQSNHESVLLELKSIEWPEIELIQNQYFNNKLSLQLTEELRRNIYRNKETYYFYTNGSLFETAPNETKDPAMGAAWVQVDENETQLLEQGVCRTRNWPSSMKPKLLAILMALYTVPEKKIVKIFTDSESAIAGNQKGWNIQTNKWWTKQKNSSIISRI
ncbi:16187_t:CDS:2, partial [Gigaspora rosea]